MPASSTNPTDVLNQMPVISPDGTPGTIPHEDWDNAAKSGFKRAVFATSPEGKLGVLHPEDADLAVKKYKFTIGQPFTPTEQGKAQQPGMLDTANQFYQSNPSDPWYTKIAKGLGRVAMMPPNVASAMTSPATAEEQQQGFTNPLARLGPLQVNRLLVDPTIRASEHIDQLAAAQKQRDTAAGQPDRFRTRASELAGKVMAGIPILGPMALQMGEQAAKGDVPGTVAETLGYSALPEFTERAKPVIGEKVIKPTTELAHKAGSAIAESTPVKAVTELPQRVAAAWNPEKNLTAEQAATKAFRPRNAKYNWKQEIASALPDMKRAAEQRGVDTESMTLEQALKATTDAKKDVWNEYEQNHLDPASPVQVPVGDVGRAMRATIPARIAEQNPQLPMALSERLPPTTSGI